MLLQVIEGMGELHLEIIIDRLKREFKVEAEVGKPQAESPDVGPRCGVGAEVVGMVSGELSFLEGSWMGACGMGWVLVCLSFRMFLVFVCLERWLFLFLPPAVHMQGRYQYVAIIVIHVLHGR